MHGLFREGNLPLSIALKSRAVKCTLKACGHGK